MQAGGLRTARDLHAQRTDGDRPCRRQGLTRSSPKSGRCGTEFAARADYDVGAIFRLIREMQDESEREYVEYPARRNSRGLRRVAGRLTGDARRPAASSPATR